jgi:hypothetical protein
MGTYTPPGDERIGSWERGLNEEGLRRKIGPTQNYDDHT